MDQSKHEHPDDELKRFGKVIQLRKLTQQAINPTIKSIEAKLTKLFSETQDIRNSMSKIDEIMKEQSSIHKLISQTHHNLDSHKNCQLATDIEINKQLSNLSKQTKKTHLEADNLRLALDNQNQLIEAIRIKNEKINAQYATLDLRNENAIKTIQNKYHCFTREVLGESQSIKNYYQSTQSDVAVVMESFNRQKNALEEKEKVLELYLQEREQNNAKFQDLYAQSIAQLSRHQFEGHRLTQQKYIEDKIKEIQDSFHQLFPMSLRKILPQIQSVCEQFPSLLKQKNQMLNRVNELTRKQSDNHSKVSQKIHLLQESTALSIQSLDRNHRQQTQRIGSQLRSLSTKNQQELRKIRQSVNKQITQKIRNQMSQLEEGLSGQFELSKNTMQKEKNKQLLKNIHEIQSIREEMKAKSEEISKVATSIHSKLEGFSMKISKIRTDFQLFSTGVRKQVNSAIKFKDQFRSYLQGIGQVLSVVVECLFISGSFLFQSINIGPKTQITVSPEHQVFVTNNDGIIYELNTCHKDKKDYMQYRKQKINPRQFVKSYMYSMVSYFDSIFESHEYLNWKNTKPSAFFYERCFDNYKIRVAKQLKAKPSEHLSTFQMFSPDTSQSQYENRVLKKGFRTVQSRVNRRFIKNESSSHLEEEPLKKSYSIKKSHSHHSSESHNPASSRSKKFSQIPPIS